MWTSTISDNSQPESCCLARDKLCRYQCPPGEGGRRPGEGRGITPDRLTFNLRRTPPCHAERGNESCSRRPALHARRRTVACPVSNRAWSDRIRPLAVDPKMRVELAG